MTSPDLLEQAVAEAEQKQVAASEARKVAELAEGPFEHFDIVQLPEWIAAGVTPIWTATSRHDIAVSKTVQERWESEYDRSHAGAKQLMVVRPKSGESNWEEVLEQLKREGLHPATIRELVLYLWSPTEPTEVLWAPGITVTEGPLRIAPYRMARPGGRTTLGNGNTADPTQPVTRRHTILVEPNMEALARIQKSSPDTPA